MRKIIARIFEKLYIGYLSKRDMKANKKDLLSSATISFDHNNTYITKYIYRKSEKPLKLNRVFRVKVTKRAKRWL